MNNPTFNDYNQYESFTQFSYQIISYLIQYNEDIWKLLKYPSPDALSQPNLTQDEKVELIYKGEPDSTPFRVFRQSYYDDSTEDQKSVLNIYVGSITPRDRIVSDYSICMECIAHNKIMVLDDGSNRAEVMMQNVLKTLNGHDVGGIGVLAMDSSFRNPTRSRMISFNRAYRGFIIEMGTHG